MIGSRVLIIAFTVLILTRSIGSAPQSQSDTHAIVDLKESCLLGGVQNHRWLTSDRVIKSLKTPQTFKLYKLDGPAGEVAVNKLSQRDCPGEWSFDAPTGNDSGIAITSPSWDVMPRTPRPIDLKDTTYVQVIDDILKHEGISKPEVNITEGYNVDLDGDGKDEVVILASHFKEGIGELSGVAHASSPGDYAVVIVRKIVNNNVRNIFIVKDVRLKANVGPLVRGYHLSSIADVNGDGVMEIVLFSAYHEGSSSQVIQITETKASTVLECSCEH